MGRCSHSTHYRTQPHTIICVAAVASCSNLHRQLHTSVPAADWLRTCTTNKIAMLGSCASFSRCAHLKVTVTCTHDSCLCLDPTELSSLSCPAQTEKQPTQHKHAQLCTHEQISRANPTRPATTRRRLHPSNNPTLANLLKARFCMPPSIQIAKDTGAQPAPSHDACQQQHNDRRPA